MAMPQPTLALLIHRFGNRRCPVKHSELYRATVVGRVVIDLGSSASVGRRSRARARPSSCRKGVVAGSPGRRGLNVGPDRSRGAFRGLDSSSARSAGKAAWCRLRGVSRRGSAGAACRAVGLRLVTVKPITDVQMQCILAHTRLAGTLQERKRG